MSALWTRAGEPVDLHRAGRHDDALDLAQLLRWCDSRFNGQVDGHWEIVRGDSR